MDVSSPEVRHHIGSFSDRSSGSQNLELGCRNVPHRVEACGSVVSCNLPP